MAKMAVAVAVGATIGKLLPPWLVAVLTAVSFIGVAIAMWRQPDVRTPKEKDTRILRGAAIAFTTIFLSEWGDKGMTTAGVWAAANVSSAPSRGLTHGTAALLVWIAAVAAMVTKGGLAVTLGLEYSHMDRRRTSRRGACATWRCSRSSFSGILSVLEVTGILVD